MSSAASTSQLEGAQSARGTFLRSKLGSFLAVLPLGVWTVNHLWNNLSAFKGEAAWRADVTEYAHPVAFFLSSVVALLPLALHTIWGIGRLTMVRPNLGQYRYFDNLKFVLQRLSALGLLLFLGAHLWMAFLRPRITTGAPETFKDIATQMHHHGPTLTVYTLGILGVAYHLANGLQTFAMGWGFVSSRKGLKKLDVLIWIVFIGLLAMGWGSVYALWDAGGHLPAAAAAAGAAH